MTNEDLDYRTAVAVEGTDTSTDNIDAALGNWASVEHGQDTVATAGTAEALNGGTSLTVPDGARLVVKALGGNGGNVYVGADTVSASNGYVLAAGEETPPLGVTDVSSVFIDVDTGGEGVSWVVESN